MNGDSKKQKQETITSSNKPEMQDASIGDQADFEIYMEDKG